jgi:Zn-dependent protease
MTYEIRDVEFDRRELKDFALAWGALTLAFTFFLTPLDIARTTPADLLGQGDLLVMSFVTVGTAFLLHELAHKLVAVRFGQVAAFRADYPLLGIAVISGLAGFLFAAPGAVYHRGRISVRENGLVAVAGPVTNLGLGAAFFLLFLPAGGFLESLARLGVVVNVFLAAFNMLPAGPLDGRTVLDWHRGVFAVVLLVAIAAGAGFVYVFGL